MIASSAAAFMPGIGIRKPFFCVSFLKLKKLESLFSMLEIMQFLSLFSLINVKYTPTVLVSYYKSLSVSTLEFLPSILDYIVPSDSDPTERSENNFDDNFRYHPSLSGKDFLFNIGNVITAVMITAVTYGLVWIGAKLWTRLVNTKNQYNHTVIYCTAGVTFLEVFLSACIQLKFVPFLRPPTMF